MEAMEPPTRYTRQKNLSSFGLPRWFAQLPGLFLACLQGRQRALSPLSDRCSSARRARGGAHPASEATTLLSGHSLRIQTVPAATLTAKRGGPPQRASPGYNPALAGLSDQPDSASPGLEGLSYTSNSPPFLSLAALRDSMLILCKCASPPDLCGLVIQPNSGACVVQLLAHCTLRREPAPLGPTPIHLIAHLQYVRFNVAHRASSPFSRRREASTAFASLLTYYHWPYHSTFAPPCQ